MEKKRSEEGKKGGKTSHSHNPRISQQLLQSSDDYEIFTFSNAPQCFYN